MTTSLVDDPCLVNQMPSILKLCSRSKDLGDDVAYAAWLWLQNDVSGEEQRRRLAIFVNA